jgi:hypothetical protein
MAACLGTGGGRSTAPGDMAALIARAERLVSNEYYTIQVRNGGRRGIQSARERHSGVRGRS